jgi:methionyl aminopeptidase
MVYKIPIKTEEEIKLMREGGMLLGAMLNDLREEAREGLDVWQLEETFLNLCLKYNVEPACKNYQPSGFPPFPTGLCLSINEQAVHCYPKKGMVLKDGDLLTIDTVIKYQGYYLDSAISFGIGNLSKNKKELLEVALRALKESLSVVKPGIRVGLISQTMQKITEDAGYSVLVDYAGHGIGKRMHEPPEIPCFGFENQGMFINRGMTLAIEPLICENNNLLEHKNYWETKTVDGGNFVQVEETVLVTDNGYENLTKSNNGR